MRVRSFFPVFARIRKSSKYFGQGTDDKGRARLFAVSIGSDWTARGGLVSLVGKTIAAKDRLILEFDAVSALLTDEERKSAEEEFKAHPLATVGAFITAARAVIERRGQAEPEESILADGFEVESEVAA